MTSREVILVGMAVTAVCLSFAVAEQRDGQPVYGVLILVGLSLWMVYKVALATLTILTN